MRRGHGAGILLERCLDALCDTVVVGLQLLGPGSLGERSQRVEVAIEGGVHGVGCGREIGLRGGQEVELLLLVGVELEVVRHVWGGEGDVVDHGEGGCRTSEG